MSPYIKVPGINELNSTHKTSLPEYKTVSPHPYKYIEYQQVFVVFVAFTLMTPTMFYMT